jgi:cytochrome P450
MVRPAVARGEISQLEKVEKHVAAMLRRLKTAAVTNSTIELQGMFLELTLDSAMDFLLGVGTTDSLTSQEAAEKKEFANALDRAQEAIFWRMRMPRYLRWLALWKTNRQFEKDSAYAHAYADRLVAKQAEKLAREKEAAVTEDEKKSFIFANELLKRTGGDALQTRWELVSILTAARDTTAYLLTGTFHRLARHPDVWRRLQEEVAELEGRVPGYEDLKRMTYLKHVLNEGKFAVLHVTGHRPSSRETSPPSPARHLADRPLGRQGHGAPTGWRARRSVAVPRAQGFLLDAVAF